MNSYGAEVLTATSARAALAVMAEKQPDILVSDISMPGEDGYSLIRNVRALGAEQGGDIPALALTAFASAEDAACAHSAGFNKFLGKPFKGYDLLQSLVNLAKSIPRH